MNKRILYTIGGVSFIGGLIISKFIKDKEVRELEKEIKYARKEMDEMIEKMTSDGTELAKSMEEKFPDRIIYSSRKVYDRKVPMKDFEIKGG